VTDTTLRESGEPPMPAGGPRGEVAGFDWRLALLLLATAALGVFAGAGWLITVGALVVMIFLHELGHFVTAKWSGMKVTEFFLFFGPKIWSFRRGETEYGIKCIPLGAYVRIIGMSNIDQDVAPEDEPRTYRQQSYPKRLLVVCAGSISHFLQAIVLTVFVFAVLGVPGNTGLANRLGAPEPAPDTWTVGRVIEDTAAAAAGLEVGDELVSIGGERVAVFTDVGDLVAPNPAEQVEIVVLRDGEELELEATLGTRPPEADDPDAPPQGFLGISEGYPDQGPVRVNPIRGTVEALQLTWEGTRDTVVGLTSFFSGGVDDFASDVARGGSEEATEPSTGSGSSSASASSSSDPETDRLVSIYGILRIGQAALDVGLWYFLLLMAGVNISIGLLNMIPLLPLDGGHAAIATYERVRSIGGRRYMVDVSRLLPITYAVFMFMMLLGLSAIYLDIVDPIG
jgi:membrane-associated protease RseP (regulator of RpoE activity)